MKRLKVLDSTLQSLFKKLAKVRPPHEDEFEKIRTAVDLLGTWV